MRRERPKLVIVAEYMVINGESVLIDPLKTDLPDRCKLAWKEMITGQKHALVKRNKDSDS